MGDTLRVKVQARDVSLALTADSTSSILNRLPVQVRETRPAANPAHVLVSLDAGGNLLLARITRFSAEQLTLHAGQVVYAQIKSVALLG
jgi:molybdate transport system ATP-binding protein